MSQELAVMQPKTVQDAMMLSEKLVKSGFLPASVKTPEAALAIILSGSELGMSTMQSLRSIVIIQGKPTMSADLMLALCKRRIDVCKYFRLVNSNESEASYETQRAGEPEPTRMTFTMKDAERAQLLGNPTWKKYPAAMLRARCIAALTRAVYPDLVLGVYETNELQDSEPVEARVVAPVEAEIVNMPKDNRQTVKSPTSSEQAIANATASLEKLLNKAEMDRDYEEICSRFCLALESGKMPPTVFDALVARYDKYFVDMVDASESVDTLQDVAKLYESSTKHSKFPKNEAFASIVKIKQMALEATSEVVNEAQ